MSKPLNCPHCGSRRVRKSERSRLASLVAFVPLLSCFRCVGCGKKFIRPSIPRKGLEKAAE